MIRILIVDDHAILRAGLKHLLSEAADIVVGGEAGNGVDALALAREGHWDAIVLDMSMPGKSGIELIRQLKAEHPRLPVLVLSMYAEDIYAVRALRAGAAGYLTKEAAPSNLLDAIRKVTAGGRYISPAVAEQLATQLTVDATRPLHESLSDREFEVLRLIASGRTVGDIADQLSLSVKTISTYRARILEKMGMNNNAELMQYAIANKLSD